MLGARAGIKDSQRPLLALVLSPLRFPNGFFLPQVLCDFTLKEGYSSFNVCHFVSISHDPLSHEEGNYIIGGVFFQVFTKSVVMPG